MSAKLILGPNPANHCFGCGGANDSGMKLTFELDETTKRATGKFILGSRYAGGAGFAHGGVIAILLDEVMGKISKLTEERAVTGWQEEEKGRNRFRIAEIHAADGTLLARGRGRFVVIAQPATVASAV